LEGGIIVSRLIDADNLDFTFDRRCFSEGDTQYVRGADDAIGVVNNAPTIDAVPVVRCARCRHGEAFKTFPGGIFCPYIKDTVPPDGYCYMGEEDHYD